MSTAVAQPRLRVAFAGAFAVRLEQPVRVHLSRPCDVILADEVGIVAKRIAENIHRAARGEPPVHLIPAAAE
jgi:hypothetical protein